jgi:hypothetical protein
MTALKMFLVAMFTAMITVSCPKRCYGHIVRDYNECSFWMQYEMGKARAVDSMKKFRRASPAENKN